MAPPSVFLLLYSVYAWVTNFFAMRTHLYYVEGDTRSTHAASRMPPPPCCDIATHVRQTILREHYVRLWRQRQCCPYPITQRRSGSL